jgi:hypothetical protein
MKATITLLTDFGTLDPYVAEMKAVILSICPHAFIVDISHEVEKFNVRMGAFLLAVAAPYFPAGTIHVGVVDPGVGSERRPIAVETDRSVYVGPDNGLLIPAAMHEGIRNVYELNNRSLQRNVISSTFHGRDVFAPVAAHLLSGARTEDVGRKIMNYVKLSFMNVTFERRGVNGEILHIDGFGNIITNISYEHMGKLDLSGKLALRFRAKCFPLRFVGTYSELGRNELGLIAGSHGFLEIACREASAAKKVGAKIGDRLGVGTA